MSARGSDGRSHHGFDVNGWLYSHGLRLRHPAFFQSQQSIELHGRKTWLDHLVEVDPGRVSVKLAADYAENPPEHIAVLPFVDQTMPNFEQTRSRSRVGMTAEGTVGIWTYANRLRRSFAGQMAEREFSIVPMPAIDTVLHDHGIDNWKKLMAVPPQQLGQQLGVDSVVYGEVLYYDTYYALLVAAWNVEVKVQIVSTRDGHQLLEASDDRYSVDLRPSFDPLDESRRDAVISSGIMGMNAWIRSGRSAFVPPARFN